MKTKEELNALREEVEAVSRKLHELTEEELAEVVGGRCFIVSNGMKRENTAVFSSTLYADKENRGVQQ